MILLLAATAIVNYFFSMTDNALLILLAVDLAIFVVIYRLLHAKEPGDDSFETYLRSLTERSDKS